MPKTLSIEIIKIHNEGLINYKMNMHSFGSYGNM